MRDLCSLTLEELRSFLAEQKIPAFRANQIYDWVYGKGAKTFDDMKNLGKPLQETLSKTLRFPLLTLVRKLESDDQETTKYLWKLPDGKLVESVLIRSATRRTVCVSCQVGCPARCAFCASGKEGLLRNLSPAEIVEQVLWINNELNQIGERVCHVVFMGMGEPMENYDAVLKSAELFNHPNAFHISERRITISTVGVVPGIQRLAAEGLKLNLVLSLHAPNQNLRKKIIPYARKYDLSEILEAMEYYFQKTRRDITYEYTLIANINDEIAHARELAALLQGKQCTVNLIPYNPIENIHLARPEKEAIMAFRDTLEEQGIRTTWRYTKGKDIAAACGQLALQKE